MEQIETSQHGFINTAHTLNSNDHDLLKITKTLLPPFTNKTHGQDRRLEVTLAEM